MINLANTWQKKRIGDVFEIKQGKSLSSRKQTGLNQKSFLRTSNVFWGRLDFSKLDEMDFSEDDCKTLALLPGDLLVCEGGDIGRTAIWQGEIEDCYYQNHLHRIRRMTSNISPYFAMFWLQAGFTQLGTYDGAGNKTTIPNLSRSRLSVLEMPLPPLLEQEKIAAILLKLQNAILIQDKIIKSLQELKKSTMDFVFTHGLHGEKTKMTPIGEIPQSWEVSILGQEADIEYGVQAAVANAKDPTIGMPILTNINITSDGKINLLTLRYYDVPNNKQDKLLLKKGDVLFNWRSGSQAHVGKTAYFNLEGDYTYSSFILRFRTKGRILDKFLYYYLTLARQRKFFLQNKNVSSINNVYNASMSATIPVYYPDSMEYQNNIIDTIDSVNSKLQVNESHKSALEDLFRTTLNKLMTGEIRVDDLDIDVKDVRV